MTQSHDRAVLARAAKAIFDANPNAFMGHDPSRLRLGAVLNLPPVDATGAPASAAATAGPASAPSADNATSAAASAATASAGASAPGAAGASSTVAAAAPTQGASAPATMESASSPVSGSQGTSGAATPSAASGKDTWTGSVQGSESAATANGAQGASQARPQVSSLQQLLALKNRVLMELQKHGIGKQQVASGSAATTTGAPQPSSATPGASTTGSPAHAAPAAAQPATQPTGIPQEYLGAAAIVGAGLVALLAGWTMRRRRKAARAEAAASDVATINEASPVAPSSVEPDVAVKRTEARSTAEEPLPAQTHATTAADETAAPIAPAPEIEPKSEPETFDSASAETALAAASTLGADALPRESLDHAREEARAAEAAALEQAAREQAPGDRSLDTTAAGLSLDEAPIHEALEPHLGEPIEVERDASSEAPKPLMLELGPVLPGVARSEPTLERTLEPTYEQSAAPVAPPIQLSQVEPSAQHEQLIEPLPSAGPSVEDLHAQELQAAPEHFPLGAPPKLEPAVPDNFPRDAMRALDSIDEFALPPRAEPAASAGPAVTPPVSLATQPVVAPEITAQQAVRAHTPEPSAVADEIAAGTAGAAAVAGLGAARFGALKLDFDLELPPSPAQAVPTFTPEELVRIARNKLDLAVEYIDLGDVVGARTLINEVIESNDSATRADARALLSTLAPLS
jgi:FimV-like protein